MALKEHIDNTFRIDPGPTPIFKMALSSLSMTVPLIIGYFNNHLFISMIGALVGLLIYLNDHFGSFAVRIKHLIAAFLFLTLAFAVGAYCAGNNVVIIIVLFILSFLVGKSKDYGVELEKIMLFVALQFLTGSSSQIYKTELLPLLGYVSIAFLNYLFWVTFIFVIVKHPVSPMISKRETIKKIMSQNKTLKFPLVCAIFACLGYFAATFYDVSHPYWIIGTYLIVILPDSYQSIYKSGQRLCGTIIGVVLASIILTYIHDPRIIMALIFFFSFFMPDGIAKNYWVGNVYIAALIMLFLEFGIPNSTVAEHLGFWRIVDIGIGSLLGVIAALWIRPELIRDVIRPLRKRP
ncbi:FUSC family protein [Bacteriovorax sp. PP10]|uniref:FUSC family protein n=1 Tax=Bacteriovorax antarcticus TaxID=3088717 RepID=A0ABU5VUL5_9BACT|nr:FUSC family protein [Bacteriovorax sp. PP10]MEA9356758.1 FUSC family protein [Bacteriovorax sp. PP10]